jgi:hypothetical protein
MVVLDIPMLPILVITISGGGGTNAAATAIVSGNAYY